MRQKNRRVALTGLLVIVLAAGFTLGMMTIAPQSTDPAEFMTIVGRVSGIVGALGLVMIVFGMIGRKAG